MNTLAYILLCVLLSKPRSGYEIEAADHDFLGSSSQSDLYDACQVRPAGLCDRFGQRRALSKKDLPLD